MQAYINKQCSLWLKVDGRLWKKTINAVKLCLPPCDGDCWWWNVFVNLSPKLYQDAAWKKSIKTGNTLVNDYDPTAVMYVNPNEPLLNNKTPNALWLWLVTNGSCSEFASSDSKPLDTSEEKDLVQNFKKKERMRIVVVSHDTKKKQ